MELFLHLILGTIGFSYLMYGKKQKNGIALISGIGLIILPSLLENMILLSILGVALMLLPKYISLD